MTLEVGAPGFQLQRLQVPRDVLLSAISQPGREIEGTRVGLALLGISVQDLIVVVVTIIVVVFKFRLKFV